MRRFRTGASAWLYRTPAYRFWIGGRAPAALRIVPPDPWPGDAHAGDELLAGVWRFGGQTLRGETPPWLSDEAGAAWLAEMHGFDWLRNLRAVGGDSARRQARLLVSNWLDEFPGWHPVAWAPDVLGTRVSAWIGQHEFFLASADDALRARVFDSLARQVRHLARVAPGRMKGAGLIQAVKGLAYGGHCLPGQDRAAARAKALLARELPRQVLPDGGHVERCPSQQLHVLRHLIDLRAVLRAAKADQLDLIQHAIDRMAPTLRFFRHGDGGLALFNGAHEEEPVRVDTVLSQADARGRPLRSAPHIHFERMTAGRTTLLVDVGAPPAPGLDERAHAGTLSFEMSVGRERLVVNCGAHASEAGPWRTAMAATAAHSTVTVAETNSSAVREEGGLGRRPAQVDSKRQENGGAVLVEASHDGYREGQGLVHRRRLYLAETGDDLRGEDLLEGAGGREFAVRFHLHPQVQASLLQGGDVLLRLHSGAGWRLKAAGGETDLEESVYLGTGTEPRKTAQIVVRGVTEAGTTSIKWALRREKRTEEGTET
ncbi:MAG TPA: heparinase II/III family protein [Azospirillaceae bacterium]|nr:heparinase II/III family protein [Azospirillaceae bacterium]